MLSGHCRTWKRRKCRFAQVVYKIVRFLDFQQIVLIIRSAEHMEVPMKYFQLLTCSTLLCQHFEQSKRVLLSYKLLDEVDVADVVSTSTGGETIDIGSSAMSIICTSN